MPGAYSDDAQKAIIEIALQDQEFRNSVKALANHLEISIASVMTAIRAHEKALDDVARAEEEALKAAEKAAKKKEELAKRRIQSAAEANAAIRKAYDEEVQKAQASATIIGKIDKEAANARLIGIRKLNASVAAEQRAMYDKEIANAKIVGPAILTIEKEKWRQMLAVAKAAREEEAALTLKASIDSANAIRTSNARIAKQAMKDRRAHEAEIESSNKAHLSKLQGQEDAAALKRQQNLARGLRIGAGAAGAMGQYRLGAAAYGAANAAQMAGVGVSGAAMAVGGGVAAIGVGYGVALVQAEKFNVALHDTATLLTELGPGTAKFEQALDDVGTAALNVSDALNIGVVEVLKSFKEALSSGVDYRDLEKFTIALGTFSKATGAELTKTTDLMTSFKDTFGLTVNEMTSLGDKLFNVIDVGKVNVEGMIKNLGRVLPVAKQAGIGMNDLLGAFATLSRGMSTPQAVTALTNYIRALINPSKQAQAEMEKLGITFGSAAFKGRSFMESVKEVKEKTGGDAAKLASIFEDAFGVRGAAALTEMIGLLDTSTKSIKNLGTAAAAAAVKEDTFSGKLSKDFNELYNSIIRVTDSTFLGNAYDALKRLRLLMAGGNEETAMPTGEERIRNPYIYGKDEDGMQLKQIDEMTQKLIEQFSEKYINAPTKDIGKLFTDSNMARITEFFGSAEKADKLIENLERQRIDKMLAMAGFIPVAYDAELKSMSKANEEKAIKQRGKRADARATDVQLAEMKELREIIEDISGTIDSSIAIYTNELAKPFVVKEADIQKLVQQIADVRKELELANTDADKEALLRASIVLEEKLAVARGAYEQEQILYFDSLEAFKKAENAKLDTAKANLEEYENSVLKQRTRKEVEAEEKKVKATKEANEERIKKIKEAEEAIYTISLKYNDKFLELTKKKIEETDRYAEALKTLEAQANDRSFQAGSDNANVDSSFGVGNFRELRKELEELKNAIKEAAASGDADKFDSLTERAREVYQQYRDASIESGDNPERWKSGRPMSFQRLMGETITEGADQVNASEKAKEDKIHRDKMEEIRQQEKQAEAEYKNKLLLATEQSSEYLRDANLQEKEIADRLIQAVGGVAPQITNAIGNLQQAVSQSQARLASQVADANARAASAEQKANAAMNRPTPSDKPFGGYKDFGTQWDGFLENGSFDKPAEFTYADSGIPSDSEMDNWMATGSIKSSSEFGLLSTKTTANQKIGTDKSGKSSNSSVNNFEINSSGGNAEGLKAAVKSAVDSYHKEENIKSTYNKTDIRSTSMYPNESLNKKPSARR